MMRAYTVAGATPADAASANKPVAALWNPSSTKSLYVTFISWVADGQITLQIRIRRTTTRGTPGSTVTPDADNALDAAVAPPSGALLDLGLYTAAPTYGSVIAKISSGTERGNGTLLCFDHPVRVGPGTGLALDAVSLVDSVISVTVRWSE